MRIFDPDSIGEVLDGLILPSLPARSTMPDVVGLPISQASRRLAGNGLRIKARVAEPDPPPVEGVVVAQSIAPGKRVRRGAHVELVLQFSPDGPDPA